MRMPGAGAFAKTACGLGLLVAALCVAASARAETPAAPAACAKDGAPVDYARKADLPAGVMEAFGQPMAEAGEPFQATDVITKKGLPWRRFVSAKATGCRLKLDFERGGIAHFYGSVEFELAGGKWTVVKP